MPGAGGRGEDHQADEKFQGTGESISNSHPFFVPNPESDNGSYVFQTQEKARTAHRARPQLQAVPRLSLRTLITALRFILLLAVAEHHLRSFGHTSSSSSCRPLGAPNPPKNGGACGTSADQLRDIAGAHSEIRVSNAFGWPELHCGCQNTARRSPCRSAIVRVHH
jgi:hypothetical protein